MPFEARRFGKHNNPTPVFNKRVFKAQAGIVLTDEVLKILRQPYSRTRTNDDLHKLKSVVNGLKDIHKGFQFIKDALSIVVGYEKIEANVYAQRQPKEKGLSCYYILTGSIEAVYDINNSEDLSEKIKLYPTKNETSSDSDDEIEYDFSRLRRIQKKNKTENNEDRADDDPNSNNDTQNGSCLISYTHVAGDFLGLVSGDGPEYDLPPPKSIKTLEVCEFLRIDRRRFHEAVRVVHNQYVQEVEHFINSESILRHLPESERTKLVPLVAKQEYPAGKVIVNQGEIPDHVFFVGKGRCQFFRRVFIKEAHRVELVKLGQIEKGEVFGESSVLDGSPCFCSVTSIGQVTCFLINKWAIKTNESFLNLLREHQHIFHEDDMIQHYIRDSDVWQSYKRSQIMELLDATNKQYISLKKNDIQEVLERALEFGDAKRCHSSRATRHREVGEPQHEEPLFVVPRSRRRSSAILQSNAAAVVKAVLLLRRNITDKPSDKLPPIKPKAQRIKPVSAPGRSRSKTAPSGHTKDYRSKANSQSQSFITEQRPKSTGDSLRTRTNRVASQFGTNKPRDKMASRAFSSSDESLVEVSMRTSVKSSSKQKESVYKSKLPFKEKSKSFESKTIVNENNLEDIEDIKSDGITRHTPELERIVSLDKNFIIKEIINTGNPKRQNSHYQYQRFDKSMFSILDEEKEETGAKKLGPSPWNISLVASKWMSGIRRKRLLARADRDSILTPSPTPPPLIVIEEYAPLIAQEQSSDDEPDEAARKRPVIRSLRTPSPSLEQLEEENDEDIHEYDKQEAGKPLEEKWYTSIHEARDESRTCLKQLRIDVKELKKNREKRKHKTQEANLSKIDDENQNTQEQQESKPDLSKDREIEIGTGTTPRIRKHSTARSAATSSTSESKAVVSSKSRKSSRTGRHSVHYSADHDVSHTVSYRDVHTVSVVKTRHERRRLLLLDKVASTNR